MLQVKGETQVNFERENRTLFLSCLSFEKKSHPSGWTYVGWLLSSEIAGIGTLAQRRCIVCLLTGGIQTTRNMVPTENSVRINQHPCGTLTQISSMHFPCWQAHRSLKTGSLCLVLSSSAPKCRESVSRKNPVMDQQEFGRVDLGEAAFPLQEGKHRRNWLAPARRRVAFF